MATAAARRPAPAPPAAGLRVAPSGRYDRLFYGGIAIVMALMVLVGFAPSYYLRLVDGRPGVTVSGGPITPLIHVHGALFTAWVLLFITQTALVAAHRVALHRRLGVAGAALAAAMLVAGTATAIASAARGAAPPGVDPLAFLTVPLFDMVLFAVFVVTAIVKRRDKESHKRLMLLAYASIIVAAAARLPGVLSLGPPAFFGIGYSVVLVGTLYDLASRRRVHRVYVWGGALLVASVPVRLVLSGTTAWLAFARALTG